MAEHSDPESAFLEQLGQRVRTMRGLRGMSRKVLAKVSGISERYIAQLESGKGNVSIVLLRRVSNAMGAHLEDLIPSSDPEGLLKPKAFVVLKAKTAEDLAPALKEHVKQTVGPWKYPRWIEVVDALPKTATGKIQRFKLREMDQK